MQAMSASDTDLPLDGIEGPTAALIWAAANAAPEQFRRIFPPREEGQTRDLVLKRVMELMLSGLLGLNDKCSESDVVKLLAKRWGMEVSRTPVREVLSILARDGLIIQKPQKGFFVIPPTRDQIEEVLAMAGQVEGLAVERLASRDVSLDLPFTLNKDVSHAIESKNPHSFLSADTAFHCGLAEAAGFIDAPRSIQLWRTKLHLFAFNHWDESIGVFYHMASDHDAILSAITRHDPDNALETLDAHLARTLELVGIAGKPSKSQESISARQQELVH
jgi:DNA-binding GntR family transcriptional regulator